MKEEVVSAFFSNDSEKAADNADDGSRDISAQFLSYIDELNISLEQFELPPMVKCVYKPTIYARTTFKMYVRKYCNTKKPIIYLGMNPGPWGMSQTGVPFGEISSVRDWLDIKGPVGKPPKELAARKVTGFQCNRKEVSGERFWGLFKELCGTPEKFFETSFVYNYLPEQWMKDNGCNVTPQEFNKPQVEKLYKICDPVFIKVLEMYEVDTVVAVGKFCETRAQNAIRKYMPGSHIKILYLRHPSPRAVGNTDWKIKAMEQLKEHNLLHYYQTKEQ